MSEDSSMEGPLRYQISETLEALAEALDIPPSKYQEAMSHYLAVGRWLDADSSPLRGYRPTIYPQGSFRIGTVVRPVKEGCDADYDIDLVCRLQVGKFQLTANQLKNMVGNRLKEHETYRRLLDDEGRRCWTLRYAEADGVGFHLDALPAVPEDREAVLEIEQAGVPPSQAQHALAISERVEANQYVWVEGGTNPTGYALWFDSINEAARSRVISAQKRMLFEANRSIFAGIQEVPDGLVRSPLQRVVQLLKRHRDIRFIGHKWEVEKPISIIITTLAALAYRGEADVGSAMHGILARIEDFAASGVIHKRHGEWWIPNPVNPGENFADRWNLAGSHRAETFFEWIAWVRQDLALADNQRTEARQRSLLSEAFGVTEGRLRPPARSHTVVGAAQEQVPGLASTQHCQTPVWPVREDRRVTVTASVRGSNTSTKELWKLSKRSIPKNFWLRFKASTDTPRPYHVHWQVVNTGTEARDARQLRGEFIEGEGDQGSVRWERTGYRGTHWVEAFVVKAGICVARSGRVLVRVR